jgi:hypothetical protein
MRNPNAIALGVLSREAAQRSISAYNNERISEQAGERRLCEALQIQQLILHTTNPFCSPIHSATNAE